MQKTVITKQGDPNEGREGLAEVVSDGVAVFFNGGPDFVLYGFPDIKAVGNASVYAATRLAFNQQRDHFHVLDLVRAVRRITNREYLMDGTVLRRLRELRDDGRVNYEVVDSKGKYRKI